MIVLVILISVTTHAQAIVFAEFDSFSGSNVTQVVTGTLNGVSFTMTFDDDGALVWGARGELSTFDNTSFLV